MNTSEQLQRPLGFVKNASMRKHSFIQLFLMAGVLLLSMKSLGQKYRINDLQEDTVSLKDEQKSLAERMKNIKQSLLQEAALDSTGHFSSKLRCLFGDGK